MCELLDKYAFSGRVQIVILKSKACWQSSVTKDLYVQLAEKRSSANTGIEILRPAWNGGLRMTILCVLRLI